MNAGKRILLIVSGGIAAYKVLELIRRLRERGIAVRCVLTRGGAQFVTPLSLSALTEDKVYEDLFSLTDEAEMGHIQLSRSADLVVVAPATADLLARMAAGIADDLATTVLLATDKPVLVAPAMNVRMWHHPATQANLRTLTGRGVRTVGPEEGAMACNEFGFGRMSEVPDLLAAIEAALQDGALPDGAAGAARTADAASVAGDIAHDGIHGDLAGRRAIVTSGPTHEPIDPVRYIANRSSGIQGHAIAAALAHRGARTTLVTGPTQQPDPPGVEVIAIETARQMLEACTSALPADIVVCAAAVADWRTDGEAPQKIKKKGAAPTLTLVENPDILATLSQLGNDRRPALVVGFAAETENVVENARAKRDRKGCDWIVANDVSPQTGTFGGQDNTVHLIRDGETEAWPRLSKQAVAQRLAAAIADRFASLPADQGPAE